VAQEEGFRRLHPLTPVLRGWKFFAAAVAIAVQQSFGELGVGYVLLGILASIPLGIAYGYVSWRATHYRVGPEDLRLETGVLFRRSRRVRLDRLQAVDVVRPLVARVLGLAELRLEVAGGSSAEAPLAYLSESAAHELRAELLARAAGIEHGEEAAPEAPERVVLSVPLSRLIESQVRSGLFVTAVVVAVAFVVVALVTGRLAPLGLAIPFAVAVVPGLFNGIAGQFDFTVAESPDGLRLRRGLLETRAQTVPPGRVQALRIVEPWLWRPKGWCRIDADVAGYVGEGQASASVLLPVGPKDEVLRVLRLAMPEADLSAIALAGVPQRARWLDPFAWRGHGAGMDDRFFVARRGRLNLTTDIFPHEKLQSARLSQGLVQRRLGLATLHLDTTPGPVQVTAAHRDAREARRMLDAEVDLARRARATERPDRWMRPPTPPAAPTVSPVTSHLPEDAGESELVLDLGGAEFLADPYPALARLREHAPLTWHQPTGQWLALTFEHSNQVLRDRRFGRLWNDKTPAERFEPFNALHRNQMMENEPPAHTRLRSLVAKAFARGHVERLRPRVQALTDGLLDRVDPARGFDLIADYAEPLPVAVISELLGVPDEDQHLLRPWSAAIVAMYEYGRTPETEDRAIVAAAEFAEYMRGLADERRARPRDDLVSHLVAAEDQGQKLTGEELVASAILLLNAGHEASVNAFGNGVVALLAHPDQQARLETDSALVEPAIEEMLRYDSPLQLFERTARTEVEVGGVVVPAGGRVAALLGAANRDPAAFDRADHFDITRRPNHHIAFGAGLHHCLGAPLARMELQISLPTLLRRCPALHLAGDPVRRPTFVLRGYASVPVSCG
jgi:cytochrome P450/uncharacterized membrane protein YdbT with pleckstrin-like domain